MYLPFPSLSSAVFSDEPALFCSLVILRNSADVSVPFHGFLCDERVKSSVKLKAGGFCSITSEGFDLLYYLFLTIFFDVLPERTEIQQLLLGNILLTFLFVLDGEDI